jgi:hypothetical protein
MKGSITFPLVYNVIYKSMLWLFRRYVKEDGIKTGRGTNVGASGLAEPLQHWSSTNLSLRTTPICDLEFADDTGLTVARWAYQRVMKIYGMAQRRMGMRENVNRREVQSLAAPHLMPEHRQLGCWHHRPSDATIRAKNSIFACSTMNRFAPSCGSKTDSRARALGVIRPRSCLAVGTRCFDESEARQLQKNETIYMSKQGLYRFDWWTQRDHHIRGAGIRFFYVAEVLMGFIVFRTSSPIAHVLRLPESFAADTFFGAVVTDGDAIALQRPTSGVSAVDARQTHGRGSESSTTSLFEFISVMIAEITDFSDFVVPAIRDCGVSKCGRAGDG